MSDIPSFHQGTTKTFSLLISVNSVVQDIRLDTVTAMLKLSKSDADAAALLVKEADVVRGLNGYADFEFTSEDTGIAYGSYWLEILWKTATGGVYVVYDQLIDVLERTSDV